MRPREHDLLRSCQDVFTSDYLREMFERLTNFLRLFSFTLVRFYPVKLAFFLQEQGRK